MQIRNYFVVFLLSLSFLLFNSQPIKACQCGAQPTVLDAFEKNEDVIIVEATSIEKAESDKVFPFDGIKGAGMIVKRVFKGSLKEGDSVFLGQGMGSACRWGYSEKSIGKKFLLYSDLSGGRGSVSSCSRSRDLQAADEDLLYLENIDKVRGKTRISGSYGFDFFSGTVPEGQTIAGRKIKIIGASKTYIAKTDKNGIYEIYDLPPGKYIVEPETPPGWKISNYILEYSPSLPEEYRFSSIKSTVKFPLILEKGKHASLYFYYDKESA